MFLFNPAVIVAGLVLVVQQVNAECSCSCSGGSTTWLTSPPCGLGPGVDMCGGARNLPNWGGIGGTLTGGVNGIVGLETAGGIFGGRDTSNAPIVVRPQEIAKPILPLPVSFTPVAGPCVCKKAIVRPAVLPKPVCKASPQIPGGFGSIGGVYGSKTITNNFQSSSTLVGSGGILGGVGTVIGGTAAGGPIVEKDLVYGNEANLAPADAVSLSLAYNTAQQGYRIPVEDRLTFGFRKIPEEVPHQVVFKKNIPEEQIFNLNGQIVELKPVKIASDRTVEEEAHEDLLDLQEEETNAGAELNYGTGIRRISLGEIGYGPAKIAKKTFVDVPNGAVGEAVHGVSQLVNNVLSGGASSGSIGGALGGVGGAAASALGSAASGVLGAAAGAVGSLLEKSKDGYVAGNVIYKTVPKLSQVLNPLPEVPPDETECESEEAKEQQQSVSYNDFANSGLIATGVSCGMCCKPCCTTHHFHSSSSSSLSSLSALSSSLNAEGNLSPCGKKASVLVQRL